jgi:DNA recombination protein RmuC
MHFSDIMNHLPALLLGLILGLTPFVILLVRRSGSAGSLGALTERLASSEARVTSLEGELSGVRDEKERLARENAGLQANLDNERRAAQEKLDILNDAQGKLGDAFRALSAEALKSNNQSFLELAKTNLQTFQTEAKGDLVAREKAIGDLLKPINEQLGQFKESVTKVIDDAGKERVGLKAQVETLAQLNQTISTEAKNLATALKGSNKTQGDWGEMILEHLLEASGIRKGIGFSVQKQYEAEDGKKGKPDVILNLPSDRCLVVDSKVSIDAYIAHTGAEDSVMRQAHLKSHIDSIRSHIDGLHKRDYQKLHGIKSTLDFVVMFVPVEPAFLLAISHDEKLFMDAWKKNVLLASPSTLLYVLRIVDHLWRQENQARHAGEIADRGGKLYDKLVGFVTQFQKVGDALAAAQKSHTDAFDLLSSGNGNLIRQAEMLRELGVKASRTLPGTLVDKSKQEPSALPDVG